MLKNITVSGCRMYLNSCKISDLPTYKVNDSNKTGTYTDSISESDDDDSNIGQDYEYKGKDAKEEWVKHLRRSFICFASLLK